MESGKLDGYMENNETMPPTYTIHKDKLKMGKILKWKLQNIKVLGENTGSKISDISHSNIFADIFPQAREKKEK